jgi:hypothetical protein
MTNEILWFTSGCGRIEIGMTMDDANSAAHQGQCDEDVLALSKVPEIARQLEAIDPIVLVRELREYGAWDENELADHRQNLQRILWLACNDITEEAVRQ